MNLLFGNYMPKNTSKWKKSELIGEGGYFGISMYVRLCVSGMGESDPRGKDRVIKIMFWGFMV